MTNRRFLLACCAVALFSLWIRTGFPIHGIAGAGGDDGLFVKLARSLGAGQWLGPFDNLTLVKGMFYPLFILGAFLAGLPLKIAEHLVYLAAALLLAGFIRGAARRPRLALALFVALAINPVLWTNELSRVIREGLYIGLSLALVGSTAWLGFAAPRGWQRWMFGALLGLVAAAFWLTREEGAWLLPALAMVGAGAAIQARTRARLGGRVRLARGAAPWTLAALVGATALGSVAELNRRYYGAFVLTEVQSGAFRHAYGALARITPDHWQRYVVFPRDARNRAYDVSPAAWELAAVFEGRVGEGWRSGGCWQTQTSPCPEILSGWFQWALRDAVATAGHYGSAAEAAAFYEQLAREVDAGCDSGAIACGPPRQTLAPPFRAHYVTDALLVAPRVASLMIRAGADSIGSQPSVPAGIADLLSSDMTGATAPAVFDPRLAASEHRRAAIVAIARSIARVYAAALTAGTTLACLGIAAALWRWRSGRAPSLLLLTLAAASAMAVVTRVALLSYLEVTAIPSANTLYVSPAVPFAILFAVTGCWVGIEAIRAGSRAATLAGQKPQVTERSLPLMRLR